MSVHFYVPEQADAWQRIDRDLMAKRAGYSMAVLGDLWESGRLVVHEMASDDGVFGYLVLGRFDLGVGPSLQVMWCEVHPCRALRAERDWLWDAARYLERVAAMTGCREVRIGVAEDHPSPSWLRRLRGVGFRPLVLELGISVAA